CYNTPNDAWIENLYKQGLFFNTPHALLNTTFLKSNFNKWLNKNNPRLFKVMVSDIWLNF
ncbi:MAG: hypothetical protein IT239_03565, partial [Bacteroidia bacterium]|nr:hypothetical protein [Bacteroidia bacterium]